MHPSASGPVRESTTRRWTAGIDWVTYIARGRYAAPQLELIGREIQEEWGDPVDQEKPFRLARYEGWRTPAVRVGRSGASSLIQVSGEVGASAWTRLAHASGQPTRLDVQVSLALPVSQPRFYKRCLRRSMKTTSRSPSSLPSRCSRSDDRGLAFGTVGDRTKARYLRVYDKGVESKTAPPGVYWRIELEAKKALARKLWAQLLIQTDVQHWCYESVSAQWKASGCCWPLTDSTRGVNAVSGYEPRVDDAQRLALWARTSVAPAMERLVRKYGRSAVVAMLNLGDPNDIPEA